MVLANRSASRLNRTEKPSQEGVGNSQTAWESRTKAWISRAIEDAKGKFIGKLRWHWRCLSKIHETVLFKKAKSWADAFGDGGCDTCPRHRYLDAYSR